jgi:hypothetical protein
MKKTRGLYHVFERRYLNFSSRTFLKILVIHTAPTVMIQRAWRQPGNRQPLHIWDILLQGLAVNRISIWHYVHCAESLCLSPCANNPPFIDLLFCTYIYICFLVSCTYYFFQENKSLRCSTAYTDPFVQAIKIPTLHPEHIGFLKKVSYE